MALASGPAITAREDLLGAAGDSAGAALGGGGAIA
jgi:hypothetical protein